MSEKAAPFKVFPRLGLQELEARARGAQKLIEAVRNASLEPNLTKVLRTFPATEIVRYLGNISVDTLYRRLKKDPELPQGNQVSPRRRVFTLSEIHQLQTAFGLRPKRPAGQECLVVSVCNFKGGVAKTTTAVHLAQYLTLIGLKVLAVDLDAQSSLSQSGFGLLPHTEVPPERTARAIFDGPDDPSTGEPNPEWTGQLKDAIQPTHWDGLDLIASNLGLYGAEFSIASRIRAAAVNNEPFLFYDVLRQALAPLKDEYDVILLDTAPSLSFVNSNALFAADALIITLPPASLDVQSASLFFDLIHDVLSTVHSVQEFGKEYEFGGVLLTKMRPSDSTHQTIASWIRTDLGDTFTNPMVQSVVLEKLGARIMTMYEADPVDDATKYEGDRRAFDRAFEAMNAVNAEIEEMIQGVWARRIAGAMDLLPGSASLADARRAARVRVPDQSPAFIETVAHFLLERSKEYWLAERQIAEDTEVERHAVA
jgi:chromosome partitioning protein